MSPHVLSTRASSCVPDAFLVDYLAGRRRERRAYLRCIGPPFTAATGQCSELRKSHLLGDWLRHRDDPGEALGHFVAKRAVHLLARPGLVEARPAAVPALQVDRLA